MNAASKITYEAFAQRVAERADVSEAEADAYIHQLARTTGKALEDGDDVKLYHFGRFRTTHVDEHAGQNPNTGEALTVEDHTRVNFQPYKSLLVAVNWPFRNLRTRMQADKEDDSRASAVPWLLLGLALLALLAGMGLYTWLSSPNEVTTAPNQEPAAPAPEQPASDPTPAATTTDTDTGGETATGTDTDPATSTETGTDTSTETGTVTGDDAGTGTDPATGATPSTPTEPVAATTTMVVAPGDTLWDISQAHWGDTSWWPVIYAENRADLAASNPDLIETGISLRLPELEGSVAQPTDADLRQKAEAYRIVANDYEQLGDIRATEYRRFVNREFGDL